MALARLLTRLNDLAVAIGVFADHVPVFVAALLRLLALAIGIRVLTGLTLRIALLLLVLAILLTRGPLIGVLLILLSRTRVFGVRLVGHDVILSLREFDGRQFTGCQR
jgi:hypothetical protein